MIILGAQNVRPCERTSVKRGVAPIVSAQRGTSGATNGGGGPQAPPTRLSFVDSRYKILPRRIKSIARPYGVETEPPPPTRNRLRHLARRFVDHFAFEADCPTALTFGC